MNPFLPTLIGLVSCSGRYLTWRNHEKNHLQTFGNAIRVCLALLIDLAMQCNAFGASFNRARHDLSDNDNAMLPRETCADG